MSGIDRRSALAAITASLLAPRALAQAPGPQAPTAMKRLAIFSPASSSGRVKEEAPFFSKGATGLARYLLERGWDERSLKVEAWTARPTDEKARRDVAKEIVESRPDAIWTISANFALALTEFTKTIPIVAQVGDPVAQGLAKSDRESGTNVTGISFGADLVLQRQLQLFREVAPRLATIHVVGDVSAMERIAGRTRDAGLVPRVWPNAADFEAAASKEPPDGRRALWAGTPRDQERLAQIARRLQMPATGLTERFVQGGGLFHFQLSYPGDPVARVAVVVDKVLRDANPATTPFEQPTVARFIVNIATARAIEVEVPKEWLALASQVIEK